MQNCVAIVEKREKETKAVQEELAKLRQQVEVQNGYMTGLKQANERLKSEAARAKEMLAEVSQSDLAKKTLLLQTELE